MRGRGRLRLNVSVGLRQTEDSIAVYEIYLLAKYNHQLELRPLSAKLEPYWLRVACLSADRAMERVGGRSRAG